MEAGSLQDVQDSFIAETGLGFSFLFAIYDGGSGGPATERDCEAYAETIGSPSFPVFADGERLVSEVTPITHQVHPEMCAIAPDMTIIKCFSGHGGHELALTQIRDHAGL